MMKELLNINLVSYSGTISRVDLSDKDGDISFKIYHKAGNEIPLNQLNAGAKQTVMQVLLKVLYELGDYAKWTKYGDVVILGRTDNQVKLRGLRIELGEIEKCLSNINGIKSAVAAS